MYFYVRYAYAEPNVVMESVSIQNMVLPIPVLFLVYDFFYTILHWGLHIKSIYGYIHKHHHHQKAPSRANVDAVNVHPVEYFLGEYNHLWTLYLVSHFLGVKVHGVASILFLAVGGLLAGLNHTRFDISFGRLYDSKAHDVHHRIPQSNYGQYTMFWDNVFGSFRPYDPKDRINPMAQLHPETGKSLQYMERITNQRSSAIPSKKSD
jgi:sterol desaturase/sphingolipid hydroxylase (fatty acid hydroxylase superfamily)